MTVSTNPTIWLIFMTQPLFANRGSGACLDHFSCKQRSRLQRGQCLALNHTFHSHEELLIGIDSCLGDHGFSSAGTKHQTGNSDHGCCSRPGKYERMARFTLFPGVNARPNFGSLFLPKFVCPLGSDDTALKMDCSCSRASNTRSGEGCGVANSRGSSFVERSSSPTNFFQNDVRRFLP